MTIPSIQNYPLPQRSELQFDKVKWHLEPKQCVLLVHDMQDYFLQFYGPNNSLVRHLIENIRTLISACRCAGIPVIFTAQPINQSKQHRGLLNDMWGPGIDSAPHLKGISQAIQPELNDIVLTKWRYSAFEKTNLLDILSKRQRNQLLITGVYAHIGCLMTAVQAFMQDIMPFVLADGIADFSRSEHDWALSYVSRNCGRVLTLHEALHAIQ